jgi:hypothetical protein
MHLIPKEVQFEAEIRINIKSVHILMFTKNLNTLVGMSILELKIIQGNHYYQNLELHRILSE